MTIWTDDEVGGNVWSEDEIAGGSLGGLNGAALVGFTQSGSGAATQTVQSKLRRTKELDDRQSVDNTGATSVVTQFQNAVADLGDGGRLIVRRGRYLFTLASDSDTILLPNDFTLDCEEGTIFEWNYLNSPLFAIVEKQGVLIQGAMFDWNGTLSNVSGTQSNRFGYTGNIGNLDMCAAILSLGSSGVRVRHSACRRKGDSPTLATEAMYEFFAAFPNEDNTTKTTDNAVEDCKIDDAVMGCLINGQDRFRFKNIRSRRFPGNHPMGGGSGLNGHLIYATHGNTSIRCSSIDVRDIVDFGGSYGTLTSRGDNSVQLKSCEDAVVSGITSRRPTGALHFEDFVGGVVSDVTWRPATVVTNGMSSGLGGGAAAGITETSFRNLNFVLPDSTDFKGFAMVGMTKCDLQARISASHTTTSVASSTIDDCDDNNIHIDYTARNTTTGLVISVGANTASHDNVITINPIGANHRLRPLNNTNSLRNVYRLRDNVSGLWSSLSHWGTEANSPAIGFESVKKTKVYRIPGGPAANPTTTFQLPREGVWVGVCSLMSSTGAHSLSGLYRIAWDTGSLQSVELIGTEWTVGASAPTVLGLAVSNAGVVTVTSTATSASYDIQYDFTCMGNYRYADF